MALKEVMHAIQSIEMATQIRESGLVYPVIMATHLTGMAVFGGMVLMTDLRLLGLVMKSSPIVDVVGGLRILKRIGAGLVILCGILLGGSEADKYYPNPYFWLKMAFLALICVHALAFRPSVYGKLEEFDKAGVVPTNAKVAATLSLILWAGMVTFGRLIAYYD